MTTVLIIRHGETDHNKHGIMQGHLDVALNKKGREQARKLSQWLAPRFRLDHIYSSPLARAHTTADSVAEGQSCPLTTLDDLQEINIGLWQGLTSEQAQEKSPDIFNQLKLDPLNTRRPGGESYWDLSQRTTQCLSSIVAKHPQGTICLVTHGGCVRTLLAHALSLPPITFSFVSGLVVDNTGLSILKYQWVTQRWQTHTINSTAHLT